MRPLVLILLALVLCGCAPKRPTDAEIVAMHIAHVKTRLPHALVTQVAPPAGPFDLTKPSHWYLKAYVAESKRTFFIDAYVSTGWTIAAVVAGSDEPIYAYSFYRQMPFGVYMPIRQ